MKMMASSSLTRPVELSSQPADARRELARLLAEEPWEGDVDGVILAVHEAMVNSQRHGGGVTRARACVDHDTVTIEISDRGRGFQVPPDPAGVDVTAERGRGLYLISHLADDVRVARAGADVRLTLRFER
jgi:anti-sigma regulatory factor (Ser/Thr protein kinase)